MRRIIYTIISIVVMGITGQVAYARYGSSLCNKAGFDCYVIKKGDTWESLFPHGRRREVVMRLNRKNTRLVHGSRIAVPTPGYHPNEHDHMGFSPFQAKIVAPGRKMILVSLSTLAFAAYDANGVLLHWGPISGGRNHCADLNSSCRTPIGKFKIYRKSGASCASSKFPLGKGGAPMPHCMFFHKGFALHGSHGVPGYHDSHGCLRLFHQDAKWLNEHFTAGSMHVPVVIAR